MQMERIDCLGNLAASYSAADATRRAKLQPFALSLSKGNGWRATA